MSSSPRPGRPQLFDYPLPCLDFPCTTARSCCASTTAHRRRRYGRSASGSMASVMFLLAVLNLLLSPVAAVLVSTFDNCLPDNVKSDPNHIQFHPVLVAAAIGSSPSTDRQLEITVWGTVTGESSANPGTKRDAQRLPGTRPGIIHSSNDHPLGPANAGISRRLEFRDLDERQYINGTGLDSPSYAPPTYWDSFKVADLIPSNSSVQNGTIVDEDPAWGQNVATTLITTARGTTSGIVQGQKAYFCANTTNTDGPNVHGTCPMNFTVITANQTNDITYLVDHLSRFTWNHTLPASFLAQTIGVEMKIITGDKAATVVGCIDVEVTPILSDGINEAITWAVVGVVLLVTLAAVVAAITNPWSGTWDVYRWSSNYGMDEDAIRLVTPGFADCLHWIQFMVLTGALSLNYPGFYQPVVANLAWSTLLVNTSFFSGYPNGADKWKADGIYAPEAWLYGYERLAQSVGLLNTGDIWTCVALWFCVVLLGFIVLFQLYFWGRWVLHAVLGHEEQDLTNRNWPFSLGMVLRITFTYFLVPLLTASLFQLTVSTQHTSGETAGAAIVVLLIIGIAILVTWLIWSTNPSAQLLDELPLLLKYGTFYNTYREKNIRYFVVQLYVDILRGIAFGALQPSGIAQITILAVCEMVTILTVWGIRPHPPPTSMNLWHTLFSMIRLATLLLMMTFIPSIGANDVARGWIGYVILIIHAVVLLFMFILKALQTFLELGIRAYRDEVSISRGGLTTVFGARQLSRRKRASRSTTRSSTTPLGMSAAGEKRTLTPSMARTRPHSRSNSSAVLLGSPMTPETMAFMHHREGSQSGHNHSNSGSTHAGFTPTAGSQYSYGPAPLQVDTTAATTGPFYRPPRTRGMTVGSRGGSDGYSPNGVPSRGSWNSDQLPSGVAGGRHSRGSSHLMNEIEYLDSPPTPPPGAAVQHHRTDSGELGNTDYAVREVDFYYGVRGPALSSQPGRRLGTGPADPTGPVSVAKSWLKQKLGLAKGKEERGFSVVRSSRAPEALIDAQRDVEAMEQGEMSPEGQEEGIGMAVTSGDYSQHQPDDEDDSSSSDSEDAGPSSRMLEKRDSVPPSPVSPTSESEAELPRQLSRKPTVPRKSSKRKSREHVGSMLLAPDGLYDPPMQRGSTSRLPFEEENKEHKREDSGRSVSTNSSLLNPPEITDGGRPASVGEVQRYRVGEVVQSADERGEFRGSVAELVRGSSGGSRGSRGSRRSWVQGR